MGNRFFSFILVLLWLSPFAFLRGEAVLKGCVLLQNSNGTPVPGVQVKTAGASNPTITDAKGFFFLHFLNSEPGDVVVLDLDINQDGLEVVNRKELRKTLMRKTGEPVTVILCETGSRDRYARIYYKIAANAIERSYEEQLKTINVKMTGKDQEIARLRQQRSAALTQAKDLSAKFAEVNLDHASELYKNAFALFKQGKIDDALAILKDERLALSLKKSKEAQKKAAEAFRKSIDNYILKARLLKLKLKFDQANTYYQIAVDGDTENLDNQWEYTKFLYEQNKFQKALHICKKSLELSASERDKAIVLQNTGLLYRSNNDYLQAEKHYNQALTIIRQLAKKNPGAYKPDTAITLNNLATLYRGTQRLPEAEKYYSQSLTIYRQLAKKNPAVYKPFTAALLNNLGTLYCDTRRIPQAAIHFNDALTIYRQLAKKNPTAYEPKVATTLNNLATLYSDSHRFHTAEKNFNEALAIMRKLAKKNPDAHEPDLAWTLNNLAALYLRTRRFSQAEKRLKESLTIYKQLEKKEPDSYEPTAAKSLHNIGLYYLQIERFEEGLTALLEAQNLREKLARQNPAAHEINLCRTLNAIALVKLVVMKLKKESLNLINRSITILKKYPQVSKAKELLNMAVKIKKDLEKNK